MLEELNRRIDRFTYRPESVKELPSSGWSTPPHFANADEQASLSHSCCDEYISRA